mmetsp:Transcript_24512/g.30144  ORF Transcript_24512/g.30144 Transcript_24512/m.30144 type:complete len:399 (+) Transcript_24512:74-1270(+)
MSSKKTGSKSSNGKSLVSEFRAKVAHMKNWKPNTPPSNRDRLELYALHKQAVASDASDDKAGASSSSPAERAKFNAWSTKRGLSQSQAMVAYILEADRQIIVYGNAPSITPNNSPDRSSHHNNSSESLSGASASVLLTPRGLAAIPLLCAAASESRPAYLARLESTGTAAANTTSSSSSDGSSSNSSGWWMRQEPLCGDPGTVFALPETLILNIAAIVERFSLYAQTPSCHRTLKTLGLSPAVMQSFLWPLHNVLLVVWMLVIFLSTLTGSAILTIKTMLFGSKRTGVTLENIFLQEIKPCQHGTVTLCEPHQVMAVRLLGLVLYPLRFVCGFSEGTMRKIPLGHQTELFVGSGIYVLASLILWWYWFFCLPSFAIGAIALALNVGWCFSLIELANIY